MPAGNQIGSVSIKVTPDTSGFREELRAALAGVDDDLKVKLDLDENGIRQKVRAATSGLDKHAKVTVDVDVDKNRVQSIAGEIGNIFKRGFATDAKGAGGSFPLGAFADNLVLVGAVAAIAAPAIALVVGALATLPAVISAVAAPIGVIALGLDGIKKAAEVLQAPLAALKTSISGVFETRLTPIFQDLGAAMPKLEGPLKAVANGISDVAKSFVDTITTGPGLANLQATIGNIATTISTMAPGVGHLTNGLLALANQVSANFPQVGEWFNKAAAGFSAWTDRATKDGSLQTAMGNLGTTLKGVLDIIGDIAIQGFDWLKDPNFGQSMKDFVANTKTLVNDILPGLAGLFQQISGALNPIVSVLDRIDKFKPPAWMHLEGAKPEPGGIGRSLALGLDDALPKLDQVEKKVQGMGAFPGMNKTDKPWFGGAVGRQLDNLEGWLQGPSIGLKNLQDFSFGDMFKDLTGAAAPDFSGIWEKIKAGFNPENILGPDTGTELLNSLALPQASADAGQQAGASLGQGLGQSLTTVGPAIQTQIGTIGPQISAQLQAALVPLQQIPAQIQTAFSGIGAAVTGSMATVVGAVAGAGGQIVAAFTGSLSQIPGVAANAFSQVAAAASAGMANVVSAISNGAAQAVSAVQTMATGIVTALQNAAAGAQAAGAAVGQGMAAGIAAGKGAAVAAAQDLAAAVTAASQVKLGIHSPSKVFTEIGSQTAQGLADGIDGGTQGVVERATALAQKITDAVNGGLTGVDSAALADGLKQQLAELEIQRKTLKVQKDQLPKDDKEGRAGLQSQMDQITALKDQLGLQKDQLGFADKYGSQLDEHKKSVDEANNIITESIASMIDGIKGFAMANVNQFQSDLGISGQGAIPTIAGIGLDWASSQLANLVSAPFGGGKGTTIQVNSVDEALAAKTNLDNKAALQFAGR
jgi:hypothetical protein